MKNAAAEETQALSSLTNPSSVTETAPAGSHTTPQLDGRRESAFPSGGARAASAYVPDSKGIKSPSRESGSSEQSLGRSLIFDLKIKDPSDFGDLCDDLDHTRESDLINGDLDLKITL